MFQPPFNEFCELSHIADAQVRTHVHEEALIDVAFSIDRENSGFYDST